ALPSPNLTVSSAGPPSRSSSNARVIFYAIPASLAAIGYLTVQDQLPGHGYEVGGPVGCEVGGPVGWEVGCEAGGPAGWEVGCEAGGPVGWEAGGPAGWELWEDDGPGCGTAAQ